jgi:hypothetical protein
MNGTSPVQFPVYAGITCRATGTKLLVNSKSKTSSWCAVSNCSIIPKHAMLTIFLAVLISVQKSSLGCSRASFLSWSSIFSFKECFSRAGQTVEFGARSIIRMYSLCILTVHNLAVIVSAADSYFKLILQFTYPNQTVTRC